MFEAYIVPALIFAGVGLIAGILLTVCSKIFAVKTDERLDEVCEALPQINCGACGYSGCNSYAEAVLKGAPVNQCMAGGVTVAKKIGEIMGVEAGEIEKKVAFIKCSGSCEATEAKYVFHGVPSCAAANRFYNGSENCNYSCLGFGDCKAVCPNDAIVIKDRLARIDRTKCVGCGLCAKACPDKLIVIKNLSNFVDVACSSCAPGKETREICKSGCIGCKICEKKCPNDAIHVVDNLARIDYDKCTSCGECVKACPRKIIHDCRIPNTAPIVKPTPKAESKPEEKKEETK